MRLAQVQTKMQQIRTVDSHTGGEPTRVVIEGGPDLGTGTFAERFARLTNEFDSFRSGVVNEPRGSDVLVGALLCQPDDATCAAAAMFFNNTGFLGMCGHGTIGLIETLRHLGHISAGNHRIQTPAGIVTADLTDDGEVAVENVPSYRLKKAITIDTSQLGSVTGDVAYGGNWFFLVHNDVGDICLDRASELTQRALQVRATLAANGITGTGRAWIYHVEFFTAPTDPTNNSRNFVLCPGGAYDRSPCGTGTSAKLACLAADGKLMPDEIWRQESIVGSVFACSYRSDDESGHVIPTIRGRAYVTAESTLVIDPDDPFRTGIS